MPKDELNPECDCARERRLEELESFHDAHQHGVEVGKDSMKPEIAELKLALEMMAREYVVLEANVVETAWVAPYGSKRQHNKLATKVVDKYLTKAKARITQEAANPQKSSPEALLKHAGKWKGDDLDECLKKAEETRSETKF